MSHFLHHEPCPECDSRDNLGVWDDGHKFCFGCGYYIPATMVKTLDEIQESLRLQQQQKETTDASITLPADCNRTLPQIAVDWLQQYRLTQKEIHQQNSFLWSESYESLIYAVFDPFGSLLMWQSRYFGKNLAIPRFRTTGTCETCYHIFDRCGTATTVTLVEDIISAIKVGRVAHTMPLWGSNVSSNRLLRLSSMYPKLNICAITRLSFFEKATDFLR